MTADYCWQTKKHRAAFPAAGWLVEVVEPVGAMHMAIRASERTCAAHLAFTCLLLHERRDESSEFVRVTPADGHGEPA